MPAKPAAKPVLSKKAAAALMWQRGNLRYKLDNGQPDAGDCTICGQVHTGQKGMYDAIRASPGQKWFLGMSRRRGKTFLLCVMAVEYAISHPGAQIHYAASTAKAVKKMVRPNFRKILADCPAELRPKWNAVDSEYVFPNGAIITVAGCDNENYENLRGTESHFVVIDEAGFIDHLQAVMDDVLLPMTLETNATIVISSTPPRSLDHYSVDVARECQQAGRYFHQTMYDNPRLSQRQLDAFLRKLAGSRNVDEFRKTATFRREMMGEFVADSDAVVIPEWMEQSGISVTDVLRPPYFDTYISSDIGYRDGWGILFAWWDFKNARLVVEDELLYFKTRTEIVANGIKRKRDELWGEKKVYRLISDNDPLTIADLATHGLYFSPTAKDDKENQVNRVREWVQSGKLFVNPRCQKLLFQLRNTVWNEKRDDFVRTKEGHGDLLDALIYLCRNVDRQHNPYPADAGPSRDNFFINPWRKQKENRVVFAMLGLDRGVGKA